MNWQDIAGLIGALSWFAGFVLWIYFSYQTHRARKILIRELAECLLLNDIYRKLIDEKKKENECPK